MSLLKANWCLTRLAVVALAVLALSVTGVGTAQAGGDGTVSLTPNPREIGVGGQGTIAVELTPPAAGTSIWIIQAKYDPAVAEVAVDGFGNPLCVNAAAPAGFETAFATGCDTKDTDATPGPDTIVAFGGAVKNVGGTAVGLTAPITVATFTFEAVGDAGTHTDLMTTVTSGSMLGPTGEVQNPTVSNGRINIAAGTSRVWGDWDCTGGASPIAPRDGQQVLKAVLSQPPLAPQTTPCPAIGDGVTVDGTARTWGDSDCTGGATPIAPRDGQQILKYVLGQPPLAPQTTPCPNVGDTVTVS